MAPREESEAANSGSKTLFFHRRGQCIEQFRDAGGLSKKRREVGVAEKHQRRPVLAIHGGNRGGIAIYLAIEEITEKERTR